MGNKKMKFPSLFKNKETTQPNWQWPSCKHPKTLSFRANDEIFKTVNSIYFDPETQTPESWFTNSSESVSFSSESECETIIRGARSERLFFEPGEEKISGGDLDLDLPFKESVVMAMDSDDPYVDFKRSMEEMVETHGLKEWECLEELLGWYLKMNGKVNHGFIVGAFVDLLVGLVSDDDGCGGGDTTSFSSAASCFSSSPCCSLSPVLDDKEEDKIKMVMS